MSHNKTVRAFEDSSKGQLCVAGDLIDWLWK